MTSDRLRICLVTAAYRPYPSGVSEHVHHLAVELQRRGHSVHILATSFDRRSIPQSADPSTTDSLPVTRFGRALLLPINRSYATVPTGLGIPFQVPWFFWRHRFDLIHCHGVFPPELAYWALMETRMPAVVTFHTVGKLPPKPLVKAFRLFTAGLNRRIAARIAMSRAGADFARRLFPGEYHVIPCGIDLNHFSDRAPTPLPMRDGRPTVLFVGRFDERKGLPVLLRAMPGVIAAVPSVRLIAVGGGMLENQCRRFAISSGIGDHVVFAGRVSTSDLPGYYAGCTVFCSPATGGEALGLVLIEAMAAGRPVVASNITGYNEVVTTGLDGLLVPAEDPDALAAALTRVLLSADLRTELSARARSRAGEFAWPDITERVERVYREVL